jgi:hypothetical protein
MIKRIFLILGIALAIPAQAAPVPNIVLMLADDLGTEGQCAFSFKMGLARNLIQPEFRRINHRGHREH